MSNIIDITNKTKPMDVAGIFEEFAKAFKESKIKPEKVFIAWLSEEGDGFNSGFIHNLDFFSLLGLLEVTKATIISDHTEEE